MNRSLNLPDKLYERLKIMSDKKGTTISAIIKIACSEYLDREEKK